jgi:hypothetical protein
MRTIKVIPIYGWGWMISGKSRFEEPAPFTLQLECVRPGRWTGIVLDETHEFHGQRVRMSKRHVDWDGYVNIVVEPCDPAEPTSTGFGIVSEEPIHPDEAALK